MTRAAHQIMAWLSPAYPIGAFSYSHGLEQAITAGDVTDAAGLQAWVEDILSFGAGWNDAVLLAAAYLGENVAALAETLAPSKERHLETMAQGTAFAKTTSEVTGKEFAPAPLPVVMGQVAAAEDIPVEDILPLALHAFAANIIAAGVRFIPLGQTEGQKVLTALFPLFDDIAAKAIAADIESLGSVSVLSDIRAMQHETLKTRIFRT